MGFMDAVKELIEKFQEDGYTEREIRNIIDKAEDKEKHKLKVTEIIVRKEE